MPINLDQKSFGDNYDAFGNIKTPIPGNDTPTSNPGIIYEPANKPTNPGALKVARQTSENLTFLTRDLAGSKITIGTYDLSPATTDGMATIILESGSQNANVPGSPPVFMGVDDARTSVIFTQLLGADTIIPPLQVIQTGSSQNANKTEIAAFTTGIIRNTHFSPIFSFYQDKGNGDGSLTTLYMSDGTTPNFSAEKGDICINGSGGAVYYNNNGSTGWTQM